MPNTVAYGFLTLEDLFNQRVVEVGTARVYTAVRESTDEYNRVVNAMMGGWVQRTTNAQERIELAADGSLQPITPDGNPLPIVPSGVYTVAYPIQGGATAWGTNRVSGALLTVGEANRFTDDAFQRDADWRMRHMLAALLDNASWTYEDKIGPDGSRGVGTITIQPLANGDAVTYNRRGGSAGASNDHYLAQAAAIADGANPFPTLKAELMHHPSNSGPFVAYIASNLVDDVTALAEFVEASDPDIQYGSGADTVSAANRATILGPGDEVLGKLKSSNMWIVEWSRLPDNYILAVALGAGPVLAMREYPAAQLQGFFPEGFSPDGNHQENRFIRFAGFGVQNRVAAAVMLIGAGAYAVPAAYDAPLAA